MPDSSAHGISIPINASTPISSFKRSIGELFIEKRIFTLQNQNIKKIQCNSDILPWQPTKNDEQIYDIIETINRNNKQTESNSKTDTAITDLTYNENSLGNNNKENYQTHITKQFKEYVITMISQSYVSKVVILKKLKRPSHLHACRKKDQQRIKKI